MKNNSAVVLDFGSGKITCMYALRTGDEFVVKYVIDEAYDGYGVDGWYSPDSLGETVESVVLQMQAKLQKRIKSVFVGVPGAFSAVATSEASKTFMSNKKIDAFDLSEIVRDANIFKSGEVINLGGKAVYYVVDGSAKVKNPLGVIAGKISGLVSFSFMKRSFGDTVGSILKKIGIRDVHYVCSNSAICSFVSKHMHTDNAVIIDVGHISTSVMYACDGGIVFGKTFALGSGYFAGDLMQVIKCKYNMATDLLTKINLNLEFSDGECYSAGGQAVSANRANEIVKARIAQIGDYVKKSFAYCDKEIPSATTVVLTGGGLTHIKGAADYLALSLNKSIVVYSSETELNRNEYVSTYALVENALESESYGIFGRK